jgi:hypothetical protein
MLIVTEPDRWITLNPAKAAQGIRRLLMGICFACGKDENPVEQVRKSLAVAFFCCDECRLRYDEKELRYESERLMLLMSKPEWKRRMTPMLCPDHDAAELTCRFCKKNRLTQNPYTHEVPVMCDECWMGIQRMRAGEARQSV